MKSILVVGGHSAQPADVQELQAFGAGLRQLLQQELAVTTTTADMLQFVIEPNNFQVVDSNTNTDLQVFDLIILRNKMRTYTTVAYCLSRYCAQRKQQFFNDYSGYFPGTKPAQAVVFYEQSVPFLKTVFAMDNNSLAKAAIAQLSFPLVLKDASGAKGEANYLIQNAAELDTHLAAEPQILFMAQAFCPNDCDYRLLLAGSEHLVIKRQGSAGTHLNNTSKGAQATIANGAVPAKVVAQAHRLAAAMRLTISGVDVMPRLGTNDFYFIETNSQPQLFTGSLLPQKTAFLRHFLLQTLK